MSLIEFSEFLKRALKEEGINQAELSRRSGLSPSQVSKILTMQSPPGKTALIAIADALHISHETIFRAAGLLPPSLPDIATIEDIKAIMAELDDDEKQDVLEYARLRLRLAEEKLAKKREQEEAAAAAARKKSGQFSASG